MDVKIITIILTLSVLFKTSYSNENKAKFIYKGNTSFKEELVIKSVTSDENLEIGPGARKWKSITLRDKSYAIGMTDTGIYLLTTRGEKHTSVYVNVTENATKILDVQLHKVWNGTSSNFDPAVLVLLEGGSLSWFKTNENLELEPLWNLELDKGASQFDVYTIDRTNYLFALNTATEKNGASLDVYKVSVTSSRYKYLWPEQTIKLEVPTTSFTLNSQESDYYLSITQKALNHVKIYKRVDKSFQFYWEITNTNADTLKSFSIGPKTYLLTNGESSGIYRITKYGPIREKLNESNISNWLPIPLTTYRDEVFLLAQKEIHHHHSHISHSMEFIHSTGFDFSVFHHEFPCVYYENNLHGLDCIVEEDDHYIELSMSAIIPFENAIGLIIAKSDLHSQLFLLNVNVNMIPNPKEIRIKHLKGIKDKLVEMQKEIHEKLAEKKLLLSKTSNTQKAGYKTRTTLYRQRNSKADIDEIKAKYDSIKKSIKKLKNLRETGGFKMKKLIVNGNVKIEGFANILNVESEKLNNDSTLDVIGDIVRENDNREIGGKKIFENLNVENIVVDTLNGIDKDQFIFTEHEITLKGNVEFAEGLEVTENVTTTSKKVNNVALQDEIIYPEKVHDTLSIDTIKISDNLEVQYINSVPVDEELLLNYTKESIDSYVSNTTFENLNLTNLKVVHLNSDNFTEILQNIVMRNLSYSIPGTLEIDVLNTSNPNISVLNTLKFPEDYVFSDSNDIHITGTKKLEAETHINSLTVNGLINGIKTSDIFTLSHDQNITENINFKNLEIVEPYREEIKAWDLKSNDIINSLDVEGNIIIEKNIADVDINLYLNNFLWKNLENAEIKSSKTFKNLLVDNIYVDAINNITVDSFITKYGNQTFNVDVLQGNVTIENLYTQGKVDDVDVKDLLENSVKLTQDQNISSILTFLDLEVSDFYVLETLKQLTPNEFLYTDGEKHLTLDRLENINASKVIVEGEVFGNIDGFDVEDFKKRILTKNGNQKISGDVHIDELHVDHLNIGKINGHYPKELFDADHYISLMHRMILENKVAFKNLKILGNFTLKSMNNITMQDVMSSQKFTKENHLQPNITFRDNVHFNGVNIQKINGIKFKDLLDNLIFKNETSVKINGTKVFLNGFEVKNYIETTSLNGIILEDILRKENTQRIRGHLIMNGNVTLEDDFELHKLNNVSLKELQKLINISPDNILINVDVLFNQSADINDLILSGYFNGKNFTDVIANSIGLNDDAVTTGNFTFTNNVHIKKDFDIAGTFNDINLSEIYKDVVFINEDDYIEGLVSFKELVDIKGKIRVDSDLLTDTIMGINPHDWRKKGVFINNGLIPGNITFENITVLNSITTKYLNNMNASRYVPLQGDQMISDNFTIENLEAKEHIYGNGLVNSVELYAEYLNTVLNRGVQNITSKIKFNENVLVYKDLAIKGAVNNFSFDSVVFTNEHQHLHGEYNFLSTSAINLEVDGLVNGINFTEWHSNTLKKNSNEAQTIPEGAEMKNLIIEDYSYGPGLISGLNLRNIMDDMAYKLQYKSKIENNFITDYKAVCNDVNYLLYASRKRIFKFKYLDLSSSIDFNKSINLVYYFGHNGQHYLIVNERQSCDSHILLWNYEAFIEIHSFKTGVLEQIIAVKSEEQHVYLIGISSNCSMHKTNVWLLYNNNNREMDHLTIEGVDLLQESLIPNTFYALTQNEAREYKITSNFDVPVYRKWNINTNDNMAFVPRGLKTGPALRDGQKIVKLERNADIDIDFDYNVQEALLGEKSIEKNKFMPGRNSEMTILTVGKQKKTMVAISSREGSSVKTKSDSIKIYSDVFKGTLFYKIPTYKPSSITSLEIGNGETLLVFFEDQKVLQVYAYKGIEGFQHVKSAKLRGQQILKLKIPIDYYHSRDLLAISNGNVLNILEVVMDGNDSSNSNELFCEL